MYKKPFLIAEVGCNHMGNMEIAKELIRIAAYYCKVDAIKFQKRCPKELLTKEQYNAPHPNPVNSFGPTYGAHREFLEFNKDQHMELFKYCNEVGIMYSTSVWDLTSAREIASLKPKFIKIPSASNTNFEMLDYLCSNYEGDIHLSLGMTTKNEVDSIFNFFEKKNRSKDLILYSCISGYPVQCKDVCLLEIVKLREKYKDKVKGIGFSGHHLGISIDVAAYTLGAEYIERHYTLNHNWKGTDHAASLEPHELYLLKKNLSEVNESLHFKYDDLLPVEKVQREKLKYRVH